MEWYYNSYAYIVLTSDDGKDEVLLQTENDIKAFCDMYGIDYDELAIGDCGLVRDLGYF